MAKTVNFNWDLFFTGQVKVSEPLNNIVTAIDDYLWRLVNAVNRMGDGVLDGLNVTLAGNVIEVAAGVAVRKGYFPFVTLNPVSLQKTADSGYVAINWLDGTVVFVNTLTSDMTPLAFILGTSVTDLRVWAGKGEFKATKKVVNDKGNVNGTVNVNWSDGDLQKLTLTGNTTLTFTNVTSGQELTLIITQGAANATLTFPTGIRWDEGTAPTMPVTVNKVLIVAFLSDGINIYGRKVINNA